MKFLSCPFFEVLYEGTRGGGKTEALLMDFYKDVGKGHGADWQGILFRREFRELEDVVIKSKRLFGILCPDAKFFESQSAYKWVFPDGEVLKFRHAKSENDYWSYHGHEIPWQGYEELTNWADDGFYMSMVSCCRTTNPNIHKRRRSTCNPYGAGHHWVKQRFIVPAENCVPHGEAGRMICRIHSTLLENKHIMDNDPDYIKNLNDITNENKRKAWLEGSWDIVSGSFFGDVWDTNKHVIKPFPIPEHWMRFRAFDWGSAAPFSVLWFCVSDGETMADGRHYPAGALIIYREWYGANDENKGLKLTVEQVAEGIKEREYEKITYSVADPAIWKQDGGESQEERFSMCGVYFDRADNSRVAGWDSMRSRFIGEDAPMLYTFSTNRKFIENIPVLLHDDKNMEDVDTTMNDHDADACRYGCMSRPYFLNKEPECDITATPTINDIFERAFKKGKRNG
jgi:hypothetical protein